MDCPKIFMNDTTSDESALVWPDQLLHERSQPGGEHFGEEFSEAMNQTYRPVVTDLSWELFLLKQHDVGLVDEIQASAIKSPKSMERAHDVRLDNVPCCAVEQASEAVRPRRTVDRYFLDCPPNLLLLKANIKKGGVYHRQAKEREVKICFPSAPSA